MKKNLLLILSSTLMATSNLWAMTERLAKDNRSSGQAFWDNLRSNPFAFWTTIVMAVVVVFGLAAFIVNLRKARLRSKAFRQKEQAFEEQSES